MMTPLQRQMEIMAESIKWQELAEKLALALIDEVAYSREPSEATLNVLEQIRNELPDSYMAHQYDKFNIAHMRITN